jgi:hypothetical protein
MSFRDFIQAALSEDKGQPSSIRLQMLLVCVTCCVCLLAVVGAFVLGKISEVPSGLLSLLIAYSGVTTGAKVVQYPKEPANHEGV